jgi:Zeta toxin
MRRPRCNAKNLIPEFDSGRGAFAVHEESSEIMRSVMSRAVSNGDNIVWPRIDSKEKIVQDVESLVKAGYKVHVRLIDIDAAEAAKSAISRFLGTGRYVPPHMIKDYGTSSRESYNAAKATGLTSSSEVYLRGPDGGFIKAE